MCIADKLENTNSKSLEMHTWYGFLRSYFVYLTVEPKKKKKKKKARRNQVYPNGELASDDTPRELDDATPSTPASTPHNWNSPTQSRSSSHKASKSPRLESLTEPEHEMDCKFPSYTSFTLSSTI